MTFRVARMNEQESEAWLGVVTMLELLPASLDAQMQRDSGLTHFEFVLLSQLRFSEEGVLQAKQLASATNSSLARLSHVITRLANRGLVERLPCPEDRRATNVALTSDGRRAVILATGPHLAHVRSLIFDQLSEDEVAALTVIAGKVNRALDPSGQYGGALREQRARAVADGRE